MFSYYLYSTIVKLSLILLCDTINYTIWNSLLHHSNYNVLIYINMIWFFKLGTPECILLNNNFGKENIYDNIILYIN